MPRRRQPPRLSLDPQRGTWTIRDGPKYVRTGYRADQAELARVRLDRYIVEKYKIKPAQRPGIIYVIELGPYIKIGFTSAGLASRIGELRVAMPEVPTVRATFSGTRKDEAALHRRFAAYRAQGEWFKHEREVAKWTSTLEEFKTISVPEVVEENYKPLTSMRL